MNNELGSLFEIRDYKPEDKPFIMATFLRGLYYGDSCYSIMPKDLFMNNYKLVTEALLIRHTVKVACLCEDKEVILGYSILSKDFQTIHWCFVKSAFRKQGIAKALLPRHPSYITHLTKLGQSLMHKFENVAFNPFLI